MKRIEQKSCCESKRRTRNHRSQLINSFDFHEKLDDANVNESYETQEAYRKVHDLLLDDQTNKSDVEGKGLLGLIGPCVIEQRAALGCVLFNLSGHMSSSLLQCTHTEIERASRGLETADYMYTKISLCFHRGPRTQSRQRYGYRRNYFLQF